MKKVIVAVSLIFSMVSLSYGEIVDRVAARVNDEIILLSDIGIRMNQLLGMLGNKTVKDSEKGFMEKRVLDSMIDEKLIVQYAREIQLGITDMEIEKTIINIMRKNNLSKEQLKEALVMEGTTMDEYKKILKEQKMMSIVIGQEVSSKVQIDDSELLKFYEDNTELFKTKEEVRVRHILFIASKESSDNKKASAKAKAEDILKRVKRGDDFANLAKLYSEDGSSTVGGDLGYFTRGKMIKTFEDVAFNLKKGESSSIVTTQFGYHIIKCEDKKPSVVQTYDEVSNKVRDILFDMKMKTKKKAFLEKLKRGAFIERNI